MQAAPARQRLSPTLFTAVLLGVYGASLVIARQLPHLESPTAIAAALTLDLVVTVPLAFYYMVIRPLGLPVLTLIPVLGLSVFAASQIVPTDQQQTLRAIELLALPIELGLFGWIAWRAAKLLREARADTVSDPVELIRRIAFDVTRSNLIAAVFASELGVLYYAFGSWRARTDVPKGWSAITHHVRSGHGGLVFAIMLVLAVEGVAVHVLLVNWSAVAAWLLTISTAYGVLWLIADYRATVLRPTLVSDDAILIRAGFRCLLLVPRERITGVSRSKPDFGKECLNLTFLGTPTRWVSLSEPMVAQGPYGIRRRVRAIGFEPDTPEVFDRLFNQ